MIQPESVNWIIGFPLGIEAQFTVELQYFASKVDLQFLLIFRRMLMKSKNFIK